MQSPSSRRTQGTRRRQRARSLQPIFFLTLSACLPSAYSLSEARTSKPNARHWQCILASPPPQGPKRGSPPSSSTLGTSGADEAEEEEFVSPWRHRQPPRPHTACVYGNTKAPVLLGGPDSSFLVARTPGRGTTLKQKPCRSLYADKRTSDSERRPAHLLHPDARASIIGTSTWHRALFPDLVQILILCHTLCTRGDWVGGGGDLMAQSPCACARALLAKMSTSANCNVNAYRTSFSGRYATAHGNPPA